MTQVFSSKTTIPPAVTVVIPCYNAETTVKSAIDSVLAQTFSDWTIVAVDDGSIDSTPTILHYYQKKHPGKIQVITSTNQGACRARNAGVAQANSDLLAFLDADDSWHPEKLARQVEYLRVHPEYVGVTCGFQRLSAGSGHASSAPIFDWSRRALEEWALLGRLAPALNSTLLVWTDAFRLVGGFDERLVSFAEDLDLSWRLVEAGRLGVLRQHLATVFTSVHQNHRNIAGMADALRIFLAKVALTDSLLASRGLANLQVYEALSLVRSGRVVEGIIALARCLLSSPAAGVRFAALRLVGYNGRGIMKSRESSSLDPTPARKSSHQ